MDANKKFIIVEFSDGLQIIPARWLNTTKETCIWPSHLKTQRRINTAIITGEMLKEQCDWEELPLKRIFGSADTYEKSMEKLILAQDTSNVDDTGMSSEEIRERNKKRKRIKAKRKLSSSEDEELIGNKENYPTQNKKILPFPQLEKFVSSSTPLKEKSVQHIENMICDDIFTSAFSDKDVISSFVQNKKEYVTATNVRDDKGDSSTHELMKQVLLKLNKILHKMDRFENMLHVLEEKIQFKDNEIGIECNIQFPLVSLQDLNNFEEQLQESQFKNTVVNTLKLVGGSTMHIMTTNILKKIMVNTVAVKFSWAGMKGKLIFKDLIIAKIIMHAVRSHPQYSQTTDAEFAESISKWLAQAPLRTQREIKRTQTEEN
ncbi:hypothetical protein ACS0PU_011629 [Formica fusca]